jgi:predicted ATP-grasp superfamily ATP-dependent carboligase
MTAPPPALILKTGRYPVHHGGLGIIRSLGRLGIPVYTVAEDHLTPAGISRYLTGSFVWNAGNLPKQEMLDALTRIGRELHKPTILIPTDDLAAILIAEEATTLRQWFVFPDILPGTPRNLANKQMLHTLCRQMGVPCASTLIPTSLSAANQFAETVGFPVVVKAAAAWLDPKLKVSIVRTERELVDVWHRAEGSQTPNLLIQEYIPHGEDWFFHGYCNGASECLAGFTGTKIRSFPPHTGITTLGRSVTNDVLLHQAETLLKAISYAGIMDIDYRFDKRDRQYKLLDFNPRIGAQFRLFEDENGLDVVRALYRDLTGQNVQRSRQVDGRVFVEEPHDFRACTKYFRRGDLSVRAWVRSFNGCKEFAWFSWDDPLPFLIVWARLAIQGAGKTIQTARFRSNAARQSAGVDQECKPDQAVPIPQYGLWSRLISIINPVSQTRARPRFWLGRRAIAAEHSGAGATNTSTGKEQRDCGRQRRG